MNSIVLLEGLREKKAEIEAQLESVKPLLEALAAVDLLIARETSIANGHTKPSAAVTSGSATLFDPPQNGRHVFEADPDSRSSQILTESRRIIESATGHELPFSELCARLPKHLVSSSKLRQYVRLTLQRSGKRTGVQYVNAQRVKLA